MRYDSWFYSQTVYCGKMIYNVTMLCVTIYVVQEKYFTDLERKEWVNC